MSSEVRPRHTVPGYALLALALVAAVLLFAQAIQQLYSIWNLQPEYSYGILIPALSAFLIWRERERLRGLTLQGSWSGLLLIVPGLALRVIGQLSTMPALVHYALLLVLYGLVLSLAGPALFRRLLMPLLILIFMVPLPPVFSEQLSLQLQLISSQLGVWIIRAAGISVYLQGNVIDLGSYQLEVAEACSGLRYLFPLMTLAFLIGYVYRGPFWKRALVFLSSIPITVIMNSLRIGLIGITVERWGTRMAEGLLHEFEGWAVFMLSSVALVGVATILRTPKRRTAVTAPATSIAGPSPARTAVLTNPQANLSFPAMPSLSAMPRSFIAATAIVAAGAILELAVPERPEIAPARDTFADFPRQIGEWTGRRGSLDPDILAQVQADDYLLSDYNAPGSPSINLYVAYYQSQRNGMSVHSPARCLPGGGWEMASFGRSLLRPATPGHSAWPVNRVVIQQGNQRALVYYYFQERNRRMTSEYLARWFLFWDSIVANRTDGALVRLVVALPEHADLPAIETQLRQFALAAESPLSRFLPD